jgi:SAM-dependent methyltransferase
LATEAARVVGTALNALFQCLGIERAHIAAARLVRSDWYGLTAMHPERIASLTLVSPLPMDTTELQALGSRLLVLKGDRGRPAQSVGQVLSSLPQAASYTLRDYEALPWVDLMVHRGAEIGPVMLDFLDRVSQDEGVASVTLPEQQGEVAGISYEIRGTGPPLILMPLDLAPSQWEPVLSQLAERYCAITLGGPSFGVVSLLEGRGQSNYIIVVRALLDAVRIQPGEVILEVGPGSGVVLRELARRTAGANPIIGVDINRFLLREAAALAKREGLADHIALEEGSATDLPLAANSVDIALSLTVMEEGDADRMLSELVRVTRPGGRIAAIVRAIDMPSWANLKLSDALRSKVDRPGLIAGVMNAGGCADASLYRRFQAAGLTELTFSPQFVTRTPNVPAEADALAGWVQRILGTLTPEEAEECNEAIAQAEADGTFFIAMGYHCAAGSKPM